MVKVRQKALPRSPGCSSAGTAAQSVVVKGRSGIFIRPTFPQSAGDTGCYRLSTHSLPEEADCPLIRRNPSPRPSPPRGRGRRYRHRMRWFDSPPCPRMDVTHSTETALTLSGPSTATRVVGGATAAFGGVFATMGLRFLRLPIPGPFKLIPLAFTAIGAGVVAVGTSTAFSSCSVEAKRGTGLTLRWKLPGLEERLLELRSQELEAFEVTAHEHHHSNDHGPDDVVTEYRLVAITKDGRAFPFESHGTRAQANLRKVAFEKILLGAR